MTPVRCAPRWFGFALLLAFWLGAPAQARAESALLLPARANDALESLRERGQVELRVALERQGVRVVSREQAVKKLPDAEGRDCVELDCATVLVRAAQVDFAVAMTLWASGGSRSALSVFVTLLGAHGARFPGSAQLDGDAIEAAVQAALADARGLQLLGPGPWLRVHGTPEGAEVHLDGAVVGSLPYRAALEAGLHTLEVRAEGYAPLIRSLQVPPSAARQVEVQVALAPRDAPGLEPVVGDAAAGDDVPAETRRVRPIVGPVVLGVAGLGLLTTSIVLALVDACDVEVEGRCIDGAEPNTGALVAWGTLGGAAIGSAILWHLLGGHDEPVETRVGLTPTGVSLLQRF